MAKPTKEYTTDNNRPSVWNQRTNDYVSPDKETARIYEQLTGDGLVQTEDGKKNGGNDRK
jgi:hypothetical protein